MEIIVRVFSQILIIIGLSRLMGVLFRKINQPLVIGEIVAGILLGPSFLGVIAPHWSTGLFPQETLHYLDILSQLGLIFFMFLVGLELNPRYLKYRIDVAISVSNAGIILPFTLGWITAYCIYPLVSSPTVDFTSFALFLGSAMSITAFPVLARIITENNLQHTPIGSLALTCAAVDDVTAWCLLALSIAVTRTNSFLMAIPTLIETVIFIALMLTIIKKGLSYLESFYKKKGRLNQLNLAFIYMGVIGFALITELIGIHFIFGAFLFGVVLPKNEDLTKELAQKTEDFVLTVLLPIFFAVSGLKTQIGLLNEPHWWLVCLLLLAVAIAGKFLGAYGASRWRGIEDKDAQILGWLMNTRGLTELIVLNIGLELKVISPLMFTMLVIMALVTTFMTSPLLAWLYPQSRISQEQLQEKEIAIEQPSYRVLVPLDRLEDSQDLLQLTVTLTEGENHPAIYPFSVIPVEEDYSVESLPIYVDQVLKEHQQALEDLITEMGLRQRVKQISPIVQVSNNLTFESLSMADQMDLIITPWTPSLTNPNYLQGKVGQILDQAKTDVAVWVARTVSLSSWTTLLLPYRPTIHNDLALELALRLLINHSPLELQLVSIDSDNQPLEGVLPSLAENVLQRIKIITITPEKALETLISLSAEVDLTLVGAGREWGLKRGYFGGYVDDLVERCQSSLLITRRYQPASRHLAGLVSDQNLSGERL